MKNKKITKIFFVSLSILFTANVALGADNSSVTENLGPASGIAGDVMTFVKWGAVFVAIISILFLWMSGNVARMRERINDVLNARENMKGWFVECIIVIVGLIFLYEYIIPKINGMV
ncbi:MAG: hypothetical protein ACPK85_10495 [Methanosarcina sp.]